MFHLSLATNPLRINSDFVLFFYNFHFFPFFTYPLFLCFALFYYFTVNCLLIFLFLFFFFGVKAKKKLNHFLTTLPKKKEGKNYELGTNVCNFFSYPSPRFLATQFFFPCWRLFVPPQLLLYLKLRVCPKIVRWSTGLQQLRAPVVSLYDVEKLNVRWERQQGAAVDEPSQVSRGSIFFC